MGHGRSGSSGLEEEEEAALLQQESDWDPDLDPDQRLVVAASEQRALSNGSRLPKYACAIPLALAVLALIASGRGGDARGDGSAAGGLDGGGTSHRHDVRSRGIVVLEGECHTVSEGECFKAVKWAQTQGIYSHPHWYPKMTNTSSFGEFQVILHNSTHTDCPMPCLGGNPGDAPCDPPLATDKYGACNTPHEPSLMTYYMYRAQGKEDYPVENDNLASLAGVMWYLHHEVVGSRPRKFHIERILRYKVTMKNTKAYFKHTNRQFGPFVAFDNGTAKALPTEDLRKYGFVVGCQIVDPNILAYVPTREEQPGCHPRDAPICRAGKWYSLPGPCPQQTSAEKSPECRAKWPGGRCPSAVVTGDRDCTYWVEFAGQISLDELEGIDDYNAWWLTKNSKGGVVPNKNIEYSEHLDKGIGMEFWDNGDDEEACTARMKAVTKMFKDNFPNYPETLPEAPCN